jgi:hypothetical protein
LGSFYYLVNQVTNGTSVTISNVGGITIDGAANLTLAPNESATLVALGPTNISVANRGGLETNNNVTFSNITASGTIGVSNTATFATNVGIGTLAPATALHIARDATNFTETGAQLTVGGSTVSSKKLIIGYNTTGDFSFLESANFGVAVTPLSLNPSGGNVGIGTTTPNAKLAVNGTMNVTGNATLSGSGNLAPSQTANSASSLMTRDLVGQEFVTPRNRMQTTYWFGLEGLGGWQIVNSGATAIANRTPKFGPSLAFYSSSKPATTAAGFGVRLGGSSITGGSAWRPVDGGAFTARTHVVNYYSASSLGSTAFGFSFAGGNNTNFWAAPDSFGLFWVQQPTNSWVASTAFALHERIAVSNIVWAVATAGTTDTNAPTWTDLIGSTVTNGTAVFRNIGPHTSNNWVLAIGHTNASQVVMTNTGKSSWLRVSGSGEALLTLRYGTNTTAPYTVYGSVADGTGQGSEVTLNLSTNNVTVSPQYWLRWDGTNTAVGNEAAGIRYFSMDAEIPPLN